MHPQTGALLNAEHGPNGGDEVNVIRPGRNYGWPRFSYGRNHDGSMLAENPVAADIEAPLVVWLPSIAPSGLSFYTGDRFPAWKGNLFVGSSRRGEVPGTGGLERVVFNEQLGELRRETLLTELHQRIRDVRQGPDGLLYVITTRVPLPSIARGPADPDPAVLMTGGAPLRGAAECARYVRRTHGPSERAEIGAPRQLRRRRLCYPLPPQSPSAAWPCLLPRLARRGPPCGRSVTSTKIAFGPYSGPR